MTNRASLAPGLITKQVCFGVCLSLSDFTGIYLQKGHAVPVRKSFTGVFRVVTANTRAARSGIPVQAQNRLALAINGIPGTLMSFAGAARIWR